MSLVSTGSDAAAGASPAKAWRTPTRPVATNRTASMTLFRISRLLYQGYAIKFRIILRHRRDPTRRWYGEWQGLTKRQTHCNDLLQLGDDDFMSHHPEWLIKSVAQFSLRHLNGTLMVRHHHRHKVSVDIA